MDIDRKPSKIDKILPSTFCCCLPLKSSILTIVIINIILQIVLLAAFYNNYFNSGGLVWVAIIGAFSIVIYLIGLYGIVMQKMKLIAVFVYWYSVIELGLTIFNVVLLPALLDINATVVQCNQKVSANNTQNWTDEQIKTFCTSATNTAIAFGIIVPVMWKIYISAVVWSYWRQLNQRNGQMPLNSYRV